MKICSKCKDEKDEIEFYASSVVKSGLTARCKSCILSSIKDSHLKDPSKIKANCKKWYSNNKAKSNAASKQWRLKNKERHKELHDKWIKDHKDKIPVYGKRYREKNKERLVQDMKVHRKKRLPAERDIQQKERDNLHDRYVKRILVYQEHVPLEAVKSLPILVELKRLEILNKREIKKQTNDN